MKRLRWESETSLTLAADFRCSQIISLIGFPKLQIFIFYPVQKELCVNIAVPLQDRRHPMKTLKTNTVEGPTVHEDAQKEMKRKRSRIREEHSRSP